MKRILITGGNRGIGLGLTRHLLARGHRLFAACRVPDAAYDLRALRDSYPESLTILPLDVTDPAQIAACHQTVEAATDGLDLLINNAGILFGSGSLQDVEADHLMRSFEVNTVAPLMVSRAFLPLLHKGTSPTILNITMPTRPITQLSRTGNHAYIASRYALNALTKMMAVELADGPVTVVAMWPGYIRTDMNDHAPDAALMDVALPAVVDVIEAITAEHSGQCLLPDGSIFDW